MNTNQLRTPALILDLDLFEANERIMNDFITDAKVKLRPHYKSNKCTAIAHMQIKAGTIGMSCSKVSEAEDLAEAGIDDILIANQVVEKNKIAQIAYLANCCRLTVCVDQAQNIQYLSKAAAYEGSTVYCLVEYEIGMQRCGVATPEAFYTLVKQIDEAPNLLFQGVQAYAGHLSHETDYRIRKTESEKIETRMRELLKYLKQKGVSAKEVSGVSTGTIEFRNIDTVYTEVQPGSYIFMDTSYDSLDLKFNNSLFILSTIMSMTDRSVSADAGLKVVSVDQGPPHLMEAPNATINLSEEHITFPRNVLNVQLGDRVHIVPSHCCTTINLHDHIYFVRDGKVLDKVPITSRGKSL